MRVYLPATLARVLEWHRAGTTPPGLAATAVTPAIREWYADGDDEEFEWAAQTMAARGSLRLLGAEVLERDVRRVVLAADVAEQDVIVLENASAEASAERGSVRLGAAVPVRSWAAVLIDEVDSGPGGTVIADAAAAIALAEGGDEDAAFTVSEADDVELLWFAVEEIDKL